MTIASRPDQASPARSSLQTSNRTWPRRSLVVAGVSAPGPCGVRDHARLLSARLVERGTEVATEWRESANGATAIVGLCRDVARRSRRDRPDVVVLHYSAFASSWRGVPVSLPVCSWWLARLGAPVVVIAHELVYPWGRRGWRGAVLALSQRLALVPLVAASAALVATTPGRVAWLGNRRWLPRRPVGFAPVFPTIRPAGFGSQVRPSPGRIGLFGYGADGLAVDLVTRAVGEVAQRVPGAHLALIGAPGADSPAGRRWRLAADAHRCPVTFTGIADEAGVSAQLAACQIVVFADPAGPSSRRTSLSAAMAHGVAVVALDGPQRWSELDRAGAVVLVGERPSDLVEAIDRLLADDDARGDVAARARAFAAEHMSVDRAAATVEAAIEAAVGASLGSPAPGRLHRYAFGASSSAVGAVVRGSIRAMLLSRSVARMRSSQPLRSLARFWFWSFLRRSGDRAAVVELAGRAPFVVPWWSQSGAMIVAAGSHESLEFALLDRLLGPGDVLVDVGANIGLYSILVASAGGRVVAFEPAPRAADSLVDSARLAGLEAALRVERVALADEAAAGWFVDTGDVGNHLGPPGEGRPVVVRPLDHYIGSIPRPAAGGLTVLKIDAEGADLRVICGASGFIRDRVPVIMVEAWDGGREVRRRLQDAGYSLFVPGRGRLEPLPDRFWQANIVAVDEGSLPLVAERLAARPPLPPRPPRVLTWCMR